MNLIHELGIVDFLTSRYSGMDNFSLENKIAEILCQILDVNMIQKETLLRMLYDMNKKSSKDIMNSQMSPMQTA